jgi:hypothetical protein
MIREHGCVTKNELSASRVFRMQYGASMFKFWMMLYGFGQCSFRKPCRYKSGLIDRIPYDNFARHMRPSFCTFQASLPTPTVA